MAFSKVIEFQGSPDLLVWKHPEEKFKSNSQLIVDPTYEALLVLNGNIADLFGEGMHTLTTSNIPHLGKINENPVGRKTAFPCKVYFINKVHQMDLLWGTSAPIVVEDPLYNVFLRLMVRGSVSCSIIDSRKFLLKLAGLCDSFTPEMLEQKLRKMIEIQVKDAITKLMINGKLSYSTICTKLREISDVLQEKLAKILDEYGIGIEFFSVEELSAQESPEEIVSARKNRIITTSADGGFKPK